MSRHVLRNDETYEVVIGYDDPLDTFFVQVFDQKAMVAEPDGPDIFAFQSGTSPSEITDAEIAVAQTRQYANPADLAEVPALVALLRFERMHRRPPTAFQRETFRRLLGRDLP